MPATTAPRIVEVPTEKVAAVRSKGPYLLVLVVVVLAVLYFMLRPRPSSGPGDVETSSVPPAAIQTAPPRQSQSGEVLSSPPQGAAAGAVQSGDATQTGRSARSEDAGAAGEAKTAAKDEIVERVMPQVSTNAQRTITGKVKVRVRVKVDAAGDVTQATLKDAGPSKYFSRVAIEAARRWKFSSAQDEDANREWTLLFVFSRARTEVSSVRGR